MIKERIPIVLLAFLCLAIIPSAARCTAITECTLNKDFYYPGQTGTIAVTVNNDKDYKIRIAELTAAIDYYYTDGVIYEQSFFTNATLPIEIQPAESRTLYIRFSLPTNVAPGYTELYVRARNELWNDGSGSWSGAEYPAYRPALHIESPYREQFQELQATNSVTTMAMYLFGVLALVFGVISTSLIIVNRRTSVVSKPVAESES